MCKPCIACTPSHSTDSARCAAVVLSTRRNSRLQPVHALHKSAYASALRGASCMQLPAMPTAAAAASSLMYSLRPDDQRAQKIATHHQQRREEPLGTGSHTRLKQSAMPQAQHTATLQHSKHQPCNPSACKGVSTSGPGEYLGGGAVHVKGGACEWGDRCNAKVHTHAGSGPTRTGHTLSPTSRCHTTPRAVHTQHTHTHWLA